MQSNRWVFGFVLAAGMLAGCLAIPNAAQKPLKESRPGRAIGDGQWPEAAVVYGYHYRINMAGFERLHPHPQKQGLVYEALVESGYLRPEDINVPGEVTREQILRVHSERFLANIRDPEKIARYIEVPALAIVHPALLDAGLVSSFRRQSGGTVLAAELAMEHGVAINLGGGFHHATRDAGGGFNLYNDLAIAARHLQAEGLARRVLIIDLDVHQGNGTAELLADDPEVFTFSMHEGGIYPIPKARSDWDIELAPLTGDAEYLDKLARALPKLFRRARPDVVFLQAGCDVLAGDPLAHLGMTPRGLVQRDAMVVEACIERKIPLVITLGGGYSRDGWQAQTDSLRNILRMCGAAAEGPHICEK